MPIHSGTRVFKVETTKYYPDGPWFTILKKPMADNRLASNPPYVMGFTADTHFARYVRFTCVEMWGDFCALQYFSVN